MKHIKVASVIGSSMNSFGDKLTAFTGDDGKIYYVSMAEGWHKDIRQGNTVSGCDEVKPNEHGMIDLTFIFNERNSK